MAEVVCRTRLPDGERHSPCAAVSRGKQRCTPTIDRIAIQVIDASFIQKRMREHRSQIALHRPSVPRIVAGYAGCIGAAYRVLRIVIMEPVSVHAYHQALRVRKAMVQTSVKKRLTIVTHIRQVYVRGQKESGQ